ncbi:hypothetical protein V6N11_051994 [Hibiscus sabdariffa]|uniref:Uncharacterized protein n=1 Tax=Hibiscus sabdariffa TaxID=183260 RepID=A0ABR2U904_9ROSI
MGGTIAPLAGAGGFCRGGSCSSIRILTVVSHVCHKYSGPLSKFSSGSFDFGVKDNGSCLGSYLDGSLNFDKASCCVIGLSLSPNNLLFCSYTISLGGQLSPLTPMSQGYLPYKANCCCIFLAIETLLLPIPRRS